MYIYIYMCVCVSTMDPPPGAQPPALTGMSRP